VLEAMLKALKQGLSPQKAAIGLAVGVALGLFPVLGTTTLLCVAAGTLLGLNHGILQAANYAVSLLYLPAFYGLMRLGEAVLGAPPLPLSAGALGRQLAGDPAGFLASFGAAGLHALVGWIVAAPLVAVALYLVAAMALGYAARRGRLEPALAGSRARPVAGIAGALLIASIAIPAGAADLVGYAYDEKGTLLDRDGPGLTREDMT
jgi:uncharacterized protein (DUF2062 family)